MRVNIFTNAIPESVEYITRTIKSFNETFGDYPITIYADPRPNGNDEIKKHFDVVETESLSDGYIKSLDSQEDYLFQLEHDWVFLQENINHSIEQILELMKKEGIYFFRFNKNTNRDIKSKWQSKAIQKGTDFLYTETDNMSNNPHIIDRKMYIEKCLPIIRKEQGSFGLEEHLNKREFRSAVYGGLGHHPTIKHIGRATNTIQKLNELK
jgi:hypothetical protein